MFEGGARPDLDALIVDAIRHAVCSARCRIEYRKDPSVLGGLLRAADLRSQRATNLLTEFALEACEARQS